ncbi:MAG: OmpA family protein [Pseudoxanthomonas sp.]
MNKKLLGVALLAGLGVAQAASAQDFDDRWYLTGAVGVNVQDGDRNSEDAPFGALGLGKFVSPTWSVDGEINYQNPSLESNQNLNWSQYGISLDLRRHFLLADKNWHPYLLAGLGYQRAEEEYLAPAFSQREEGNFAAKLGAGLQSNLGDRVAVRAEVAYRIDFDDTAVGPSYDGSIDDADSFGDLLASVGVVIPLGPKAAPPAPPPPPPAPAPAPPPPPDKITIDLNGVNFDFDKSTLRPDSIEILNTAAEILTRYPELRVEVAGHTDLCGKDAYNQGLSERRARAVYDYLTGKGIDASRLAGPIGYGESRPLEPTGQTLPGCKSEKNRRTELNVLN